MKERMSPLLTAVALGLGLFCSLRCSNLIEKPKAKANSDALVGFDHGAFITNCALCHEEHRPAPIDGKAHGSGADCVSCHKYPQWKLSLADGYDHIPLPLACNECHASDRPLAPHVQDGDCASCHTFPLWKSLAGFTHEPMPTSCNECHADKRPAAPHPQVEDCVSCHRFPDWTTQLPFAHSPMPATCISCHSADRPGGSHVKEGECASCHTFPNWKTTTAFSHQPPPSTCVSCHETDRKAANHYAGQDCVSCHTHPLWSNVTTTFNHVPKPESCMSCHEADRKNATHYSGMDCVSCHNHPAWAEASFSHVPKPATCESCHARPATGNRGAVVNNRQTSGPHYVGKDCIACHGTPPEGHTTMRFDSNAHRIPDLGFCLPCHYSKGYGEHPGRPDYFAPEPFGRCKDCHTTRRSWDN
jgi:hypothetical protein